MNKQLSHLILLNVDPDVGQKNQNRGRPGKYGTLGNRHARPKTESTTVNWNKKRNMTPHFVRITAQHKVIHAASRRPYVYTRHLRILLFFTLSQNTQIKHPTTTT